MEEKRRRPRAAKRLGCEIRAGTHRYFGMALNVSAEGLFIQTNARIGPGTPIQVTLGAANDRLNFALSGRVARVMRVPQSLASAARGGIGVRLIDPPAAYLGFVASMLGTRGPNAPLPAPQPIDVEGSFEFRVELRAIASAETRTLLVSCRTETEAAALVESELDEGWKVLSIERR